MTIVHESASIETLDLETAFCHRWNSREYVRIATPSKECVSLCLVHFDSDHQCKVLQVALNSEEVNLVIEGLRKAKLRMWANEADDE